MKILKADKELMYNGLSDVLHPLTLEQVHGKVLTFNIVHHYEEVSVRFEELSNLNHIWIVKVSLDVILVQLIEVLLYIFLALSHRLYRHLFLGIPAKVDLDLTEGTSSKNYLSFFVVHGYIISDAEIIL
jgi:hypothetical protein